MVYQDQVVKTEAEQNYANNEDALCGAVAGKAQCGPAIDRAVRVPLRELLAKRWLEQSEQNQRVARALDIITRHPEFEEFIQLQELLASRLHY